MHVVGLAASKWLHAVVELLAAVAVLLHAAGLVAEPAAELVAGPAVEPAAEPVAGPVAEPAAEPAAVVADDAVVVAVVVCILQVVED